MKKLTILTLLTVLTGLTTGLQTPQISMMEEPDVNLPSDFELSERPDVKPGFDTDLTYSYESDLVDFKTSESVEANLTGLENMSKGDEEDQNNNETVEDPEEPPQNKRDDEDDSSTDSSSSGSSDYSVPSIDVESEDINSSTNDTQTEQNNSQNNNESQETEQRTQPGIFDGPWTEKGDSNPSLRERLTGRFSESTTLGGITLLVFGGLAAYSYI